MTGRCLVGGLALAVAALSALPHGPPARGLELAAGGVMRVENSREGSAILAVANMSPGQSESGTVTVRNPGGAGAHLYLHSSPPGGGALGEALRVTIETASGERVAGGTLQKLAGCHDLGMVDPGAGRTYRFTASFPRGGDGDNAYAFSSASADERWLAGGCDGRLVTAAPARPRFVISHRRVALAGGRARVRIRCIGAAGSSCSGTVTLRARHGTSRLARAAAVELEAGRSRMARLRVPLRLGPSRKAIALAVVTPLRGSDARGAHRLITLIQRAVG